MFDGLLQVSQPVDPCEFTVKICVYLSFPGKLNVSIILIYYHHVIIINPSPPLPPLPPEFVNPAPPPPPPQP